MVTWRLSSKGRENMEESDESTSDAMDDADLTIKICIYFY